MGKRSWVADTSRSSSSRAAAWDSASGAGSTSQRCRIEVAIDTSGAERCWARKTLNTAPSSSSVRSTPVTP